MLCIFSWRGPVPVPLHVGVVRLSLPLTMCICVGGECSRDVVVSKRLALRLRVSMFVLRGPTRILGRETCLGRLLSRIAG